MAVGETGLFKRFLEEWDVVGIFYVTSLTTRFAFTLTMMIETIYLFTIGIPFAQIGVIYLVFGVIHGVFEISTGIVADKREFLDSIGPFFGALPLLQHIFRYRISAPIR